jgi:hypothetical protein
MHSRHTNPPLHHRTALVHALGYADYPDSSTAEPYLNYIANRHIGRESLEEYLGLFVRVIEHFSHSRPGPETIRALFDALVKSDDEAMFSDTKVGGAMRREHVEDTIMHIIGAWSMMLSSFVGLPNGIRKVTSAYGIRAQAAGEKTEAYDQTLAGLIRGSFLLPAPGNVQLAGPMGPEDEILHTAIRLIALLNQANGTTGPTNNTPSGSVLLPNMTTKATSSTINTNALEALDSLESLSVKATRLNAFTLNVLGAVQISWTHNISRHMLLSRHGGRHILELFALPCAFNATTLTSEAVGISSELAQEIQESYCILFNAWPDQSLHIKYGRYVGIRRFCWCWSCSAHRYRNQVISKYRTSFHTKSRRAKRSRRGDRLSEYDPLLVELMDNESSDWTQDLFPCLWSRIAALEEHLVSAKPWSIWILFRDRRDTLQFWTFL